MKKLTGYWLMISFYDKEDLPALVFTDSEENAKSQVQNMFTTSKNISFSEQQITWEQFKTYFDTTNWPEVLQVVNDGYFPDDIFGDVCDFCMRGYNKLMQSSNWTTVKIEHNQN